MNEGAHRAPKVIVGHYHKPAVAENTFVSPNMVYRLRSFPCEALRDRAASPRCFSSSSATQCHLSQTRQLSHSRLVCRVLFGAWCQVHLAASSIDAVLGQISVQKNSCQRASHFSLNWHKHSNNRHMELFYRRVVLWSNHCGCSRLLQGCPCSQASRSRGNATQPTAPIDETSQQFT